MKYNFDSSSNAWYSFGLLRPHVSLKKQNFFKMLNSQIFPKIVHPT